MTKALRIEYSEDFRDNAIPGKVYRILRNNGYDPLKVSTNYTPKTGTGEAIFLFRDDANPPPKQKELERILSRIPLKWIEIYDHQKELSGSMDS